VSGEGIGVARFVCFAGDPATAEVAVAVTDHWQHRGVGTALLAKLVDRALEEGVERFSALVLARNEPILNLLDEFGRSQVVRRGSGTEELILELPRDGVGDDLGRLLRLAAQQALEVGRPAESTATDSRP
jgi:L-amino acid N-acyltransferase YncA